MGAPYRYERAAWRSGLEQVAGVDEAGRGPLAGPVVAAAVILDPNRRVKGLDDSKRLAPARRERLFEQILEHARGVGVGIVDPQTIDRVNILEATRRAMYEALGKLAPHPDLVLIDALRLPALACPQKPLVRGDSPPAPLATRAPLRRSTWRPSRSTAPAPFTGAPSTVSGSRANSSKGVDHDRLRASPRDRSPPSRLGPTAAHGPPGGRPDRSGHGRPLLQAGGTSAREHGQGLRGERHGEVRGLVRAHWRRAGRMVAGQPQGNRRRRAPRNSGDAQRRHVPLRDGAPPAPLRPAAPHPLQGVRARPSGAHDPALPQARTDRDDVRPRGSEAVAHAEHVFAPFERRLRRRNPGGRYRKGGVAPSE